MAHSCEQALALGVPAIAFTDHLDFTEWTDADAIASSGIDPRHYDRIHLTDIPGYLATVEECRERFPGLRILTGAEVGEAHLFNASAGAVAASAGFDRVLGSLHVVPLNGQLTSVDDLFRLLPLDQVMPVYLAEIVRLIEGSDLFEVLAHLDFPRRMWPTSAPYAETTYETEYRAVFDALADGGRVLEINTKSPLASVQLLRWWRESGGRAVSFGSDAHQPWRVGDKFKQAVDIAEAAGFSPSRDPFDFWRC